MEIYLIRHGQTDLNKQHRVQGRNGLPLNAEGISQAKALAKKLTNIDFDEVYSSPQERAVQTAEIATGRKPKVDERIDVYDLGSADGLLVSEVKTAENGLIPDPKIYSGVEKIADYLDRIADFVVGLMVEYKDKPDAKVVVCGHKCTTGAISAYVEGMPKDKNFLKLAVPNGEVKVVSLGLNK